VLRPGALTRLPADMGRSGLREKPKKTSKPAENHGKKLGVSTSWKNYTPSAWERYETMPVKGAVVATGEAREGWATGRLREKKAGKRGGKKISAQEKVNWFEAHVRRILNFTR